MDSESHEIRTNRLKGDGSIYQKADGRWYYSIMHRGKRLTKSLRTRDASEALKNLVQVRNNLGGRIDRGEFEPTNVTLEGLLDAYVKHVKQNGHKSASIIESVINKIRAAREFGNGEKASRRVASLQSADFNRYRDRLVESGVSHSTVNNHLAYLRAALNLETKQTPSRIGKVPHIPIVRVSNTRQGFIEYDDHRSLLYVLPRSLKCLFVIAFHSGCRLGEVLKMRWADVDWENGIIRLPDSKSGKPRNLPFWGGIEGHLKRQKLCRDREHPDCEFLFFWMAEDVQITHGGVRIAPGTPIKDFRASWSTAVEEARKQNANVPAGLLFHDIRRSAIRVMVQDAGIPEAQAMLISGHETRSMLERYNIVSLKNVLDAGAKLKAWEKAHSQTEAKAARNVVSIRGSKSPSGSRSLGGSKPRRGRKRATGT
jgi:integrase